MSIARHAMLAVAFAGLVSGSAVPAEAQDILGGLKRKVQNAVKRETERKADEVVTQATRCAMGEVNCAPASSEGSETTSTGQQSQGQGGSVDPGGDHPLVTPYAGSKQNTRQFESYTDYRRIVGVDKARQVITQTLEGKLTSIVYNNPPGRSTLEIIRNYEQALKERGFAIDYQMSGGETWLDNPAKINGMVSYGQDVRYFTGKLRYGDGVAYVSILTYRQRDFGRTSVQVLETAEMDTGMVSVDPSAMAAELDQSGQVNLQGVYFDTGRATLKPESDAAIGLVVALMAQRPELKLQVVGHTDSVGNASSNQILSQDRANAVRNAITMRGISADRLVAYGLGSQQPIASNDTSEGRALNRRVMLLRLN
ncbi:OmpA family protein [Altererythrobacter sp. Z27]|uniref:OmpA family protein n=1 Tax=Altererythrobacter sp. Z27 TaxID=3461147 RepID=UPI004044A7B2